MEWRGRKDLAGPKGGEDTWYNLNAEPSNLYYTLFITLLIIKRRTSPTEAPPETPATLPSFVFDNDSSSNDDDSSSNAECEGVEGELY
jgi:hypothetical protein